MKGVKYERIYEILRQLRTKSIDQTREDLCKQWKIQERSWKLYMQLAREKLREVSASSAEVLKDLMVERLEALYAASDDKQKLAVLKQECELLGLEAPKHVVNTILDPKLQQAIIDTEDLADEQADPA